jgi:anthranilate synthase/aminodeoxychorismate synthase-like glutamine amidotransferase
VVVIDNYDSFVYNLVQYLGELGATPLVHRHDELTVDDVVALEPDAVVISPGPGRPEDAGISNAVIERLAGETPLLGVCLGHQCIGHVFGGSVVRAPAIVHGKTSQVRHRGQGVLAGLPDPFEATRYHSLVVDRETLPPDLEVTAETDDGTVMGIRHRWFAVEGVQFHPESILTRAGKQLLANFLASIILQLRRPFLHLGATAQRWGWVAPASRA